MGRQARRKPHDEDLPRQGSTDAGRAQSGHVRRRLQEVDWQGRQLRIPRDSGLRIAIWRFDARVIIATTTTTSSTRGVVTKHPSLIQLTSLKTFFGGVGGIKRKKKTWFQFSNVFHCFWCFFLHFLGMNVSKNFFLNLNQLSSYV